MKHTIVKFLEFVDLNQVVCDNYRPTGGELFTAFCILNKVSKQAQVVLFRTLQEQGIL